MSKNKYRYLNFHITNGGEMANRQNMSDTMMNDIKNLSFKERKDKAREWNPRR